MGSASQHWAVPCCLPLAPPAFIPQLTCSHAYYSQANQKSLKTWRQGKMALRGGGVPPPREFLVITSPGGNSQGGHSKLDGIISGWWKRCALGWVGLGEVPSHYPIRQLPTRAASPALFSNGLGHLLIHNGDIAQISQIIIQPCVDSGSERPAYEDWIARDDYRYCHRPS